MQSYYRNSRIHLFVYFFFENLVFCISVDTLRVNSTLVEILSFANMVVFFVLNCFVCFFTSTKEDLGMIYRFRSEFCIENDDI